MSAAGAGPRTAAGVFDLELDRSGLTVSVELDLDFDLDRDVDLPRCSAICSRSSFEILSAEAWYLMLWSIGGQPFLTQSGQR